VAASPDGRDVADAVAVPPGGTDVVIAGQTRVPPSADFLTVAYDRATGAQRWVSTYDAEASGDRATGIAANLAASVVYVVGYDAHGGVGVSTVAYGLI
jgi:hypothetical protein